MSAYTPTAEQVRDAYVRATRNAFEGSTREIEAEFDRWLAKVKAEAQVVTDEMIEEVVQAEIVAAVGECICHEAYTSRNKRDPDCGWHWVGDDFASDTAKVIQRLYRGEEQS